MISICIPTCNEGENLRRTVDSLVANTPGLWKLHEVIIADDGSTDGSVEAVAAAYPQLRIARHPTPTGTSAAKALGADSARGTILVFLDSHTYVFPNAIDLLASVAGTHGIATPIVGRIDADTWQPSQDGGHGMFVDRQRWNCGWLELEKLQTTDLPDLRITYAIPGQSFAIRRDVYDSAGGWDRGLLGWGSDVSLSLRLWCLGYDLHHVIDARIAHLFRTKFPKNRPHVGWWQIYANQLRILASIATPEETADAEARLSKHGDALARAKQHLGATSATIPRLHLRLARSLTDYWTATNQA